MTSRTCLFELLRRRSLLSWAAGLALFLAVAPATAQEQSSAAADDDTLYWHTDLEKAKAEAKSTGMPMFLEFRCAP